MNQETDNMSQETEGGKERSEEQRRPEHPDQAGIT